MDPNPVTGMLIRRGGFGHRHKRDTLGGTLCEDGDRD